VPGLRVAEDYLAAAKKVPRVWGTKSLVSFFSGIILAGHRFFLFVPQTRGTLMIIDDHWFIELDDGKIYRKPLYLMVKTMVSCRFSLKPIH
jgi:hypothetical protein